MTETKNHRPTIVGIGVSVWDQMMVVESFPQQEQVVRAIKQSSGLGGGVAVAMATAACLGASTSLLDSLGTDIVSDSIVQTLDASGVNVGSIVRRSDASASIASVWVNQKTASRTIVFAPGQHTELSWDDSYADQIQSAKILHLNGRHRDASMVAVDVAAQSGTKISYDGGAYRYRPDVLPLVAKSDILVVAEHFAQSHCEANGLAMSTQISPDQLCQRLLGDFKASLVGVTCGDRGSWFATDQGEAFHQPAFPVEPIVDTTGCGDTFHGALLAGLVRDLPLTECAKLAAKIASHQAQHLGAFSLSLRDVERSTDEKQIH